LAHPIKHIFVVMLENRSFDHMLGAMRAENPAIDGLRDDPAWLDSVANAHGGARYRPFPLSSPRTKLNADPPHGRTATGVQIAPQPGGGFAMNGFVESLAASRSGLTIDGGANPPATMGWFGPKQAPVTAFLARNFTVCDRWFAALPTGTQPNRLMAMSGTTRIDGNKTPMPNQKLVYDWLKKRNVRWRVYHDGVPFFTLIPERMPEILTSSRFRGFGRFDDDLAAEGDAHFPQVTFIEPTYADAPHLGPSNDDHAPGGIARGQRFVWKIYRALAAVPELFKSSVLIVTYDEHGGFFDHVPPPRVVTEPPPKAKFTQRFESLGVRVPALVVSPLAKPGAVYSGVLDHVSILKLIGTVFGGGSYSPVVDARPVGNVIDALDLLSPPRPIPAMPTLESYFGAGGLGALAAEVPTGRVPGTVPATRMEAAFQHALDEIRQNPDRAPGEYEALLAAFPQGVAAPAPVPGGVQSSTS
jgi:phospholipase C